MATRVVAGAVLVLVLLGLLAYSKSRKAPFKVSGFVEADEIRLGSRVGGRVKEVRVEEGQRVSAGDVLVVLEVFDLLERKAEAAANVAAKEAELERLEHGFRGEEIAQARARFERLRAIHERLVNGPRQEEINAAHQRRELAQAQLERARQTHDRDTQLFNRENSAISRDEIDRATEELKVAEAMRGVQEEELQLLIKGTRREDKEAAEQEKEEANQAYQLMKNGYRREDKDQAKAAVEAARAALRAIDAQLAELEIKSPVVGVVEAVELQKGDLVAANAPVLSIMDTSHLWVRAYVPADRLGVRIDQVVEATVDGFGERRFRGRITFAARQAEFTPNNVQTPEDRSRQVFRIKVTLLEGLDELRPGMMADVWLGGS